MTRKAPEYDEYKGYPILRIHLGTRRDGKDDYLSIGVKKARAICEDIDHIRRFVDQAEGKALRR